MKVIIVMACIPDYVCKDTNIGTSEEIYTSVGMSSYYSIGSLGLPNPTPGDNNSKPGISHLICRYINNQITTARGGGLFF